MTRIFTYTPSPELAKKRIIAHWYLHNQATNLLENHLSPDYFEDQEIHADILVALNRGGIVQFNRAMRAAACRVKPGNDSSPLWGIIDATGFWEDTTPGHWPYMTEERAEVLLAWACSYKAGQMFTLDESRAP